MKSFEGFESFVSLLRSGLAGWTPRLEQRLLEALLDQVASQWQGGLVRGQSADAAAWLQERHRGLARAFSDSLDLALSQALQPGSSGMPESSAFGDPGEGPALSLMDESEVEEGIALVRIERQIDQAGEWALRELHALCANLPGAPVMDTATAYPLTPERCTEAYAQALTSMGTPKAVRATLLRLSGPVLANVLGQVYEEHLGPLRDSGVAPAPMRIRLAHGPSHGWSGNRAAIGQLLESAGAQGAQPVPAAGSTGAAAAAGSTVEAVSGQLGQLLQVLARQSQAGPVMEPIWARVQACFDRLGADELRALQQPDHPFWRLLDRIAALSVVQQPSSRQMQDLAQQLEPVLGQLEQGAEPLSTMRFDSALAELDSLPMPMEAVNPRGLTSALELESRRRDIEPAVRSQLVAQLRPLAVPPTLRQFLLGPWVQVLTAALALDGPENPATERWMNAVADFLAAASRLRRGNAVAGPECEALVALAGEGMRGAGLPEHLVQGNLADLSRWLKAGPVLPAAAPAEANVYVPPELEQRAAAKPGAAVPEPDPSVGAPADWDEEWQGHADLDTVPMGMGEALVNDPASQAEREAWLSALHVGDLCRLKLQGRWVTALLTWRSDNGQFFMFKSRHAAGVHTLSRRSLERLRGEGLATRVEPGQLLAHALSALSLSTS